jgi:hypothetical protein
MNDQNSPEWPEQPPADMPGANDIDTMMLGADRLAELEAEAARY